VIVVAYAPDLADRSRIDAALPDVTFVKTPADLDAADADIVIIDLSRTPELPSTSAVRVVGYGSHVDDELLTRARAAGIEAMPRSRFFRDIAGLLA
jgi:hypothetical protein